MFNGFLMEVLITTYYYLDIFRLSTCSLSAASLSLQFHSLIMTPWFLGGDVTDVAHLKRKKGNTQFYVGVDREWHQAEGASPEEGPDPGRDGRVVQRGIRCRCLVHGSSLLGDSRSTAHGTR